MTITGIDTLKDILTEYAEKVSEGVKDAIAKTATDMADSAKKNTSGDIADSVNVQIASDGMSAVISADSPDAVTSEYGIKTPGSKTQPKPFLNPAFEENRQALIDNIVKTIQA